MGNYLDTYEKADCNGCGVCALKCPKHAISMEEDLEGFYYPVIRKDECVECGICRKVCSNNPVEAGSGQQTYIAVNPNMSDRKRSASGGILPDRSEYFMRLQNLSWGGVERFLE